MPKIKFGSKEAADQFRDEWKDYLCPDDDRRLKTVTVVSDTPKHVIERAEIEAAAGRSERSGGGGQVELTNAERDLKPGRSHFQRPFCERRVAARTSPIVQPKESGQAARGEKVP